MSTTHEDTAIPKLTEKEQLSEICRLFLAGNRAQAIKDILWDKHDVELSREAIYRKIDEAVRLGCFRFYPPTDSPLAEQLRRDYPTLRKAEVIHGNTDDLPFAAAEMLLTMVLNRIRHPYHQKEVHIGWSGGSTMTALARAFARLLASTRDRMPAKIVCHALVAGFENDRPISDPNAFFTYFQRRDLNVNVEYVGLHAPAFVETKNLEATLQLPGIADAIARVNEIDIVCTSAGEFSDEHSMLKRYYGRDDQDHTELKQLEREGTCRGDMLWQPVKDDGPLDGSRFHYQALSLLPLSAIPARIQENNNDVLLCLGPCKNCGQPKPNVLRCLLQQREQLVTHVITDSGTARAALEKN